MAANMAGKTVAHQGEAHIQTYKLKAESLLRMLKSFRNLKWHTFNNPTLPNPSQTSGNSNAQGLWRASHSKRHIHKRKEFFLASFIYVNLTRASVILEEGISVDKMPVVQFF